MLDKLTHTDFEALLNHSFQVALADETFITAELIEVKTVGEPPEGFRQAFSLLFRFMIDDPLPQQIYSISHETLGTLDIFFVPINFGKTGIVYEALFT